MSHAALSVIVARASRSADPSPETDGGLLARFAATRDDVAFTELVRRLGPMVLGVCRRVARDAHLAEDAFQAAFVVLARRAADVRPPEAVRGWLYGVAVRTAQEARAMSARRLAREVPVAEVPDRAHEPAEPPDADALCVLDEEVAALPERLRSAVVLCELDGLSRRDAAGQLGIPEGTLSSRLAKARKVLADRLKRRGLALPAAGLTVLAHATVPSLLAAQTSTFSISGVSVPARVAVLTQKVFRTMLLSKLKSASLLVPLVAGLFGAAVLASAPSSAEPPQTRPMPVTFAPVAAKVDPKPLPKGPNKVLFHRNGQLALIDPDGKNEAKTGDDNGKLLHSAILSPDGKTVAALVRGPVPPDDGPKRRPAILHVRGLVEKEPGTDLGVVGHTLAWSPDGTEIACCDFGENADMKPEATSTIVNVKTKEKRVLKLPNDHLLTDWSRDGKFFLTMRVSGGPEKPRARLYLMNPDGTEHKALTDENGMALFGRLSPDGTRVLFNRVPVGPDEKPDRRNAELSVVDVATGKVTKVDGVPPSGAVGGYCWSSNSKKIAYVWQQVHEGKPEDLVKKETESRIVVCDADGKNAKTIVSEKGEGQWSLTLGSVDWR